MLDIPITAGVLGALIAPILAAIGAVAALATDRTLVVERWGGNGPCAWGAQTHLPTTQPGSRSCMAGQWMGNTGSVGTAAWTGRNEKRGCAKMTASPSRRARQPCPGMFAGFAGWMLARRPEM